MTSPREEQMVEVGEGRGEYIRETRFRYVGPGADPAAPAQASTPAGTTSRASASSCFARLRNSQCAGASRCTGSSSKTKSTQHVMQEAGAGGGEYVMETAFKYVGRGAGEFNITDEPASEQNPIDAMFGWCNHCQQPNYSRSVDWCFRHFLEIFFAVIAIVLLITAIGSFWTGGTSESDSTTTTTTTTTAPLDRRTMRCVAEAVDAAVAGDDLPWPQRSFEIHLDHSSWERFGFLLTSEEHSLLVADIDGGLLASWNDAHSTREVLRGDRIVMVNGIADSTPKMLAEFNKPKVQKILILRAFCGEHQNFTTTRLPRTTTTHTPFRHPEREWSCYRWTDEDKDRLKSWTANEEKICTRDRDDGYEYRYAHGDAHAAPGCGGCWCCRRQERHFGEVEFLFRDGFEDYSGVVVKELRSHDIVEDDLDVMSVDSMDHGHKTQVLMRFDNIVGRSEGQIHPGSEVKSATLNLNVVEGGGGWEAHRVLVPWDTATSYEELDGDGLTLGVEVDPIPLDAARNVMTGLATLDLKDAVQGWVDGEDNYGIALLPLNSDGVDFATVKSQTPPTLAVKAMQEVEATTTTEDHRSSRRRSTTTTRTTITTTQPTMSPTTLAPVVDTTTTPATVTTTQAQPTGTVNANGLRAEFFYGIPRSARDFGAAVQGKQPDLVRKAPSLDFAHGSSRWDGIKTTEPFAARWSGTMLVDEGGSYQFEVNTDDIAELIIDGEILLGGSSHGIGLSPLLLLSHQVASKALAAGAHTISVMLLQAQVEGLLAIDVRYKGPDSGGKMVSIPQNALRPADGGAAGGRAGDAPLVPAFAPPAATPPMQRKYGGAGADDPTAARARATAAEERRVAGYTACSLLALGCLLTFLPGLPRALAPRWRDLVQARAGRRSLRRYESLSLTALVEGDGGLGMAGSAV